MSRRIGYFHAALTNVQAVHDDQDLSPKARKIYGGLCHNLPILVRQNGLAQTVAFIEDKAGGTDPNPNDRQKAYRQLRAHIGQTIGVQGTLIGHVPTVPLPRYMHDTRAILEAWIFYKRFAVSILKVEQGEDAEEG